MGSAPASTGSIADVWGWLINVPALGVVVLLLVAVPVIIWVVWAASVLFRAAIQAISPDL